MLGTQIPSIKGFGASNFHLCHWNLARWLEKLSLKGLQEKREHAYDVSCKCAFFNYLSFLLTECGKLPIQLHALKLTMVFNLPTFILVSQ